MAQFRIRGWTFRSAAAVLIILGAVLVSTADAETGGASSEMTREQVMELEAIRAAIDSAGAHWRAAPNSISLLPDEEFRKMLGGGWPPHVKAIFDTLKPRPQDLSRTYPSYWDWREMGGTTPVKDQGSCGSCWDFAATGALEGNLRVNEGVVYDLSEQQGLDCNDGGSSCDGGWQGDAYAVFTDPGAVSEECMPYLAQENTCRQRLCEKVAIMDGYQWVAGNVNSYKAALMEGPISACYTVYEDFDEYNGGCYQHVWGSAQAGHCVVIVGWDDSMCGGNGAWICKNSWGGGWGTAGYFYIKFGDSGIGSGAERPLNAHIPRERFVPDEYATIQSAIDSSQRGDVIRVAGGTYNENVVVGDYRKLYGGYDPTFQVRDLEAYPTVIDAGGAGNGFTVTGEANVVIDGFEVINATGGGSGIYLQSSDARIRSCEVRDSYRGIHVGGSAWDADVIIEHCVARDNTDSGIYVAGESFASISIRWTACYGNGADGIHSNQSIADITYCTLSANDDDGLEINWTSGNIVSSSIICMNGGHGLTCSVGPPDNHHNCVWGNAAGDYQNCAAGNGSFSEDPNFCDPPSDVSVHATSPTLEAAEFGDDMGALGIGCPTGPVNLAVEQTGASLELSWDPPEWSRAGVDHYVVYRDSSLYPGSPVGTVPAPATTFTDITVPPCVTCNYWVSAVDTDSLEGALSSRRYSQLCYEGPTDLSVTFDEGGNELSWTPGEGSIVRYEIVRSTIVDPADSVGSAYAPATTFVDSDIAFCPRDNYVYEVVPVYDTGWRGQPTDLVEVDPKPAPPAGLAVERVGSDVTLSWSPNCESDFMRYWVYRDTMPLSPPPRHDFWIGQTTDTTYVDEGLNPDWNYFYRLVSSDESSKKSDYSDMAYVADPVSRTVPGDYPTIQAAIDVSSPPDTVIVSPGTYGENLVLKDGVIVRSSGGMSVTTVSSTTTPVVSASGVCDLTRLEGLTVDGQGAPVTGLESWGSYMVVRDCAFTGCTNGVHAKFGGSPELEGNLLTANQYGVAVSDSAAPILLSNTFDGNSVAALSSSGAPGPDVGGSLENANDFVNPSYFQLFNSGSAAIDADYNYWGNVCPEADWFYGPVDYNPWTDETHTEVITECTDVPEGLASRPSVDHNYPNPFNPRTTIRYTVPRPGTRVQVEIYDLAGRLIRTLVSGEKAAGEHAAVWTGADGSGRRAASGVYFYRVQIGEYRTERKMLLLK
ncbi:MAG: T9SS type A sorting domain-containing protein [Candidatus Eisenbacteria bacterium]|nr:T9SS type A sorting domain-containing protein [Candidatus Eisenbacteria bacterium]